MAETILAAMDQKRGASERAETKWSSFKTPLTYRWLTRFRSMLSSAFSLPLASRDDWWLVDKVGSLQTLVINWPCGDLQCNRDSVWGASRNAWPVLTEISGCYDWWSTGHFHTWEISCRETLLLRFWVSSITLVTFRTLSSIAGNLSSPSFGARTLSNCVLVFFTVRFFFSIEYLLRYGQLFFAAKGTGSPSLLCHGLEWKIVTTFRV